MINRPPVKRAFQVRPAQESFLGIPAGTSPYSPAATSYTERHFERLFSILGKRTLADRNRPR